VVENILRSQSIDFQKIVIGEIYLSEELTLAQKNNLIMAFTQVGFELIDNHSSAIIEKIKQLVLKRARNEGDEMENRIKLSNYLASNLNREYTYLSSLFSSVEGRTIENYFIEQRIEKAKELLVYGQLTLSQIAFNLEYSSVAHLSKQ
jgi:AraC-like DNA-binding protein